MSASGRRPLLAILFVPLLTALCAAAGLASGLLGDGNWDAVASLGLAVALLAIGWGLWRSLRA